MLRESLVYFSKHLALYKALESRCLMVQELTHILPSIPVFSNIIVLFTYVHAHGTNSIICTPCKKKSIICKHVGFFVVKIYMCNLSMKEKGIRLYGIYTSRTHVLV